MGLSYQKTFRLGPLLVVVGTRGVSFRLRTPVGTIAVGKHGTHYTAGGKGFSYSKRLK